ncbi:MAG: phage tail tape measure protein, partial [Chloroflexi bacterium]|nr:phage tail tape measure protein [Chloroflexota bacterium]
SSIGADFVSLGDGVLKWSGLAVGAIAAAGAAMLGLAGAFTVDAVGVATSLESAFAGVVKTTDGLTSEIGVLNDAGKELKDGFKALSEQIPITPEQLMRIGELGGQLGIEKDNLLDFTETIAGIGVSTDLATEEASMGFARMMNIMGTAQGDVERIGSAVVDLGNNFATTEPDILNFALRIAGAGQIAGLTEADVLAIGAAMSSVGVEAEAGGTAVQKVLLAMNTAVVTNSDQLETYAATAGMSAAEFATAWETDAAAAFAAFVEGLGAQGDDAILTLEELELKDQRLVRAFLSLAGSGDILTDSLALSNDAWAENTALADEAAQFYATSESKMAIFRNSITNLKDDIGSAFLPVLGDMLGMLGELVDQYAPLVVSWFEERIAPAVETLVGAFGDLLAGDVEGFLEGVQGALANLVGPEVAEQVFEVVEAVQAFISEAAAFVSEHSEEFKGALVGIGAVLAAAAIASAITGIGGAIAALANPITAIIAAGALLGAAWAGDWGGIRTTLTEAWEVIQPTLEVVREWLEVNIPAAVAWMRDAIDTALAFITGLWTSHGEETTGAVSSMWATIETAFGDAVAFVQGLIEGALGWMRGWWEDHGEAVTTVVTVLWDAIKSAFADASEVVTGVVEALWSAVTGFFQENQEAIQEGVTTFLGIVQEVWSAFSDTLLAYVESLWSLLGIAFETGAEVVGQIFELFAAVLTGDWEAAQEALVAIAEAIWGGVEGAFEVGKGLVETVVTNTVDSIKAIFDVDLSSIGANIMQSLRDGISGAVSTVTDAVSGVASGIVGAVTGFLDMHSPSRVMRQIGLDIVAGLVQGIEAGETLVNDAVNQMFAVAGALGGFGGQAAKMLRARTLDPAKERLEEIDALLEELEQREAERGLDPIAHAYEMQLLKERARLTGEIAEQEERILALQKQQEDLAFLQQQMKLLDLIAEHGLDAGDILGGLEMGLDADMGDVIDAMTRAMEAIITEAQSTLGIHSPSKVAAEEVGVPLAEGIWQGFAGAMRRLVDPARYELPQMAPVMAGSEVHYHLSIQTSAPTEPIIQDFRMMEALGL